MATLKNCIACTILLLASILVFENCQQTESRQKIKSVLETPKPSLVKKEVSQPKIIPNGNTVVTRFQPPKGYQRIEKKDNSFAAYLQNLPLKPDGTKVHYYNGAPKSSQSVHAAVIDLDVGKRDLQQCADAVMRLRAEHLLEQKDYAAIHFNFTNGFEANYDKWRKGYRIKVNGNKVTWTKSAAPSDSYADFRKYLTQVYIYAGTLSLEKELQPVDLSDMQIGDVFIQGGSPGHAVIVLDMAENPTTKARVFMLAQSYMPAQDIHILKNPSNTSNSPWYSSSFEETLDTPEWTFQKENLRRF